MSNPLISIVVCCHNRCHYLEQTLDTIFAQDYEPVEIVVLDDGSTDHTAELMQGYKDKARYFYQENQGAAIARTNACKLAKGEFIAFQDDDDLMPPDRISALLEALQQYPSAVLAFGDWQEIDEAGKDTGIHSQFKIQTNNDEPVCIQDGYKATLWPEVTPLPHTSLFRKRDGERIGWFDTRFFCAIEDTDFFARLGNLGSIVYVPKITSFYRRGHQSLCANDILLTYNRLMLFEKHLRTLTSCEHQMRKRLRFRMLNDLKHLEFLRTQGIDLPSRVPSNYQKFSLSALTSADKIRFHWYSRIRLPIRNLVKGKNGIVDSGSAGQKATLKRQVT